MPEGEGFQRKMPAAEKGVSEIQPSDMRVSVTGTVVDTKGNRFVLDDGSGKIDVSLEEAPDIEASSLVRVMGRVVSVGDGLELQGEIVQDMKGLDNALLNRVRKLEGKLLRI